VSGAIDAVYFQAGVGLAEDVAASPMLLRR